MLSVVKVQGVMQAVISGWYAQGLLGFWFVSAGLGIAYYLIPKASGRPIYSRNLASLGFWSFAIFCGWTGATRYTGGPVPVWLATSGIAAGILMLIPVAATAVNFTMTLNGNFHLLKKSPAIRFIGYGSAAWVVVSLLWILTSLRSVDRITHFTQVGVGETHLVIYAFYTMVIMGSMYYIIPRLVGGEWLSPNFIIIHFFGAAYGIGLLAFLLIAGGISQGIAWADPALPAVQVVDIMSPYFRGRSIAWLLLIGGNTIFGFHFLMMLLEMGKRDMLPALLGSKKEEAKS
jgi:cytochrome c oxidase cbb3-type subunit 1